MRSMAVRWPGTCCSAISNPPTRFTLYTKRVDDRVAKIKELLKQPIDFKGSATVELSRQKSSWPKDDAEADQLWRGRIANELLQEHLSEHPIEPPAQLVAR